MGTVGERVATRDTEASRSVWPTPHELRAFVAVSDTLHFGRAAQTLGLAPSSLSELIRRLEETVDAVLLERSSRHVALTEAGLRLLPLARNVVAGIAAARSVAAPPVGRFPAVLRLGIENPGLGELTQTAITALRESQGGRTVVLREILGTGPAFAQDRLDFAIVRSPGDESHQAFTLARERRGLLVPAGHHLAGERRVAMRDVLDEPFVAVAPRQRRVCDYWLARERRGGQQAVIGGSANTTQEIMFAVGHLGLLTTGCRSLVRLHPRPQTVFVPLEDVAPNEVAVVVRRGEARRSVLDAVAVLRRVVAEHAGDVPGLVPVA